LLNIFGLLPDRSAQKLFFTPSLHPYRTCRIPKDAIDDVVPDRIYSKKELLDYLQSSCENCRKFTASLTEEKIK